MMIEVECVAALDAQEFAIDTGVVAVVAADDLVVAHAQGGFASIRAVGADGAHVLHLPGTRLVSIGAAGERTDRADVYAHAALIALEVVLVVRRDLGIDAAVDD